MSRFLVAIAFLVLLSGCSPRLSPLYRDYEVDGVAATVAGASEADVYVRLERGLETAGWTLTDSVTDNVVATEARQFREWGVYSVEIELEAAPVGGDHVRIMVHPYRKFFTGARRKIPYLRGSLARSALKDLHAALEAEGLEHIGTMQSRNRAALRDD